jgi:hypothetical protein
MFCTCRAEKETYRLIHVRKNEEMWYAVYTEHRAKFPDCNGMLQWDTQREIQHGLCWEEACVCTLCPYSSERFRLYQEIDTGKRGKKAAAPNVGIHVGLSQTSMGYEGVRKVLLSSNTPAPSTSGLKKAAHKVCETIVQENKDDMSTRRQQLKTVNKLRGMPDNSIPVEGDAAYNNPIYSGVANTPFQSATQVTYIVAEGATKKRQIIALAAKNKLCATGAKSGLKCPGKDHACTANIKATDTIGNEKAWAAEALEDILQDGLEVSNITTDPDSGAYKASEDLYKEGKTQKQPEHCLDTRHLSANMRKKVQNLSFSKYMFRARLAADRKKMHSRFAHDIVKRCEVEFKLAHDFHAGDVSKLKKSLSKVRETILQCYQGNHTNCQKQSFACSGGRYKNWVVCSSYLPQPFQIMCTAQDICKIKNSIDYRLGDSMLEKTKFNTNTQKVEATNRSLRRSLPRSVTYTKAFSGRAHSAIHSCNNGPGESIIKLCDRTGAKITSGSKVSRSLLSLQRHTNQQSQYHKSSKAKFLRNKKRRQNYDLYDSQNMLIDQDNYKKGQLCSTI